MSDTPTHGVASIDATECQRPVWDKRAQRYDRRMGLMERLFPGDRRAARLGRQTDLRLGDAQALPFPDASFDTVVCTLSLCSIPNDRKAVAEMRRVLRPGGRLLLFDHVPSTVPVWRGLQWLLEQVTLRAEAEHLLRRPLDLVRAERFDIEHTERPKAGVIEQVVARRPIRAP